MQKVYSGNMLVGLFSALFSPARAMALMTESGRLTYVKLLKNFGAALIPFALTAGTLALVWWYAVIHPQASAEDEAPSGLEQLGSPVVDAAPTTPVGPPTGFYFSFGIIAVLATLILVRYYRKMNAERLEVVKLLTSSVMPLGILTAVVLAVILFWNHNGY